jgi:hypothetical protein
MDALPDIADTIRRLNEAYAQTLSAMTKAVESFPKPGSEAQRRLAEEWLRVARMSKDGIVTAVNQGFELWERECRRALGALPTEPLGNPMEAWAENWRKTLDAFTGASKLGEAWSEEARKQFELAQQAMQEGLRVWQRFWQPGERKP